MTKPLEKALHAVMTIGGIGFLGAILPMLEKLLFQGKVLDPLVQTVLLVSAAMMYPMLAVLSAEKNESNEEDIKRFANALEEEDAGSPSDGGEPPTIPLCKAGGRQLPLEPKKLRIDPVAQEKLKMVLDGLQTFVQSQFDAETGDLPKIFVRGLNHAILDNVNPERVFAEIDGFLRSISTNSNNFIINTNMLRKIAQRSKYFEVVKDNGAVRLVLKPSVLFSNQLVDEIEHLRLNNPFFHLVDDLVIANHLVWRDLLTAIYEGRKANAMAQLVDPILNVRIAYHPTFDWSGQMDYIVSLPFAEEAFRNMMQLLQSVESWLDSIVDRYYRGLVLDDSSGRVVGIRSGGKETVEEGAGTVGNRLCGGGIGVYSGVGGSVPVRVDLHHTAPLGCVSPDYHSRAHERGWSAMRRATELLEKAVILVLKLVIAVVLIFLIAPTWMKAMLLKLLIILRQNGYF